jgi:hypothetical protein
MLGASPGAHATSIANEPVTLSAGDQLALESQACGVGHKAGQLKSRRPVGDRKEIRVEIDCVPFGTIAGLPALKIATCDNTSGRWTCPEIATALPMKFATGEALLSYADAMTPATAIEIATCAATVRSADGRDVAATLSGRCCDGWRASITRDCWDNRRRLFFTAFDEIMR